MFCMHCGNQLSPENKFCVRCGKPVGNNTESVHSYIAPTPVYKKPENSGKKVIAIVGILTAFAMIILMVFGGILLFSNRDSKNIMFGKTESLGSFNIGPSGNTILISNPASSINGFSIEIPQDSYSGMMKFEIEETQISNHRFGEVFDPVTPAITVNNGQVFSQNPLRVSIPISLEENEFALGFYYDKKTGLLEAIPFETLSRNEIVLRTSHFSNIIISRIDKEYLMSYAASIDSEFRPGIDDWQFANYGSALAPGGHCAGQSLTMAWYYSTQKLGAGKPDLYGLYDNNGKGVTSQFQEDDALSYRFASVIQDAFDFNSPNFHDYVDLSLESQENTYLSFAYALLVTKAPQFMGIYQIGPGGQFMGGHAIVAYRLNDRKIYVADPNYPGKNDRYVAFTGNAFMPYSSGANAADISAGSGTLYNKVVFVGQSALVDFTTIEYYYNEMKNKTIGNDKMPSLTVGYLSKYSPDISKMEYELIDEKLNYSDPASFPADLKGQIQIAASTGFSDVVYSLYKGTTLVAGPFYPDPEDNVCYFWTELDSRVNDYGILAQVVQDNRLLFSDFKRIEINYSKIKDNIIGFKKGDIVSLGRIEQDNVPGNGLEPIAWRILSVEGDRALVISEKTIINHPYHNKEENVTWETSNLRSFLNMQFLQTSFTQEERQLILPAFLINNNNSFDIPGGNNTIDYVFCLSIDEANFYFNNSKDRLAKNTTYMRTLSPDEHGGWWLRSPGRHPDRGATVSGFATDQYEFYIDAGDVVETGTYGTNHRVNVRPAMWISLIDLVKTQAPVSTPVPTGSQGGDVESKLIGVYSLEDWNLGEVLEYYRIELKKDGTLVASYKRKGDSYIGGYNGTWEAVEEAGEIWLRFYVDGNVEEAIVASNFSGFKLDNDGDPMYFTK